MLAKRRERTIDIPRAAAYHEQLPSEERVDSIDDRTWRDLDLDDVFASLDNTASEPGRQVLYDMLRTPRQTPEPLERLEHVIRALSTDSTLVEKLRTTLGRLGDPRAGQIANVILSELPPRPRFWPIFPALTLCSITCLALIAMWPRALIVWIAMCVLNIAMQVVYKPRVQRFVPALHELPRFARVAEALGSIQIDEVAQETTTLRDGAKQLGMLRWATRWLMFEPAQKDALMASLYEYVNLLFLLDVNAFVFALESLRALRPTMRAMFDAMGYLDAAQSIGAWRASLPRWATPIRTGNAKALTAADIVHPLVVDPVANTIDIRGKSILITGSNMSGKTTFVRALGVNAVLAQTLNTVCGSEWRGPMLTVRTSIHRADSVQEGKSYYLAEIEAIRSLADAKASGRQHMFLLDEIFRGTNTTERVAAAYAVLRYLDRGTGIVVVATHDVEVIELLGGSYEPQHFREQTDGGVLSFDYRLHPGPSSTRNAIALLEIMRFPADVVSDALSMIDWERRVRGV